MKITLLPGDGIGVEIVDAAVEVLDAAAKKFGMAIEYDRQLIGGAAIDAAGVPLPEATIASAKNSDAVLLGAVGGPKWDNVAPELRPEKGLLGIRKALGLYCNLRPIKVSRFVAHLSPLKNERVEGTDMLIVRELTGGIYFGAKNEAAPNADGVETASDVEIYTRPEVERVWYPGLESHPGHDIAARQMHGGFGGMISIQIAAGFEAAKKFAGATKVFTLAESLGGVESLIEHPGAMTHASVAGTTLEVPANLIRLSVGLEDADDLIADLEQAFRQI